MNKEESTHVQVPKTDNLDSGRLAGITTEIKNEVERYAETIPELCRGTYLRAARKESSPRQAIKAKCCDCMGYENAVKRVRECSSYKCPLWMFRPYQS